MNKEEIFNEISSCFKMSVDMNGMKKIEEYITNLQQQNQKYKEVIDKAINNSQYWIDYYTRLNSDERIALRLQENIDILKEVE
ncbi:hypothetical protein [Intestinibacter sp.]|uniref:hypothetical protein n=1 Tax=Intestinibacter sp. TaxID=1965304 RepID=UPI002A759C13|nr:hypothetical protein [Intestinibacter sp.]MDY2737078.1 hypothetical protein [Intestinibacter sp.]